MKIVEFVFLASLSSLISQPRSSKCSLFGPNQNWITKLRTTLLKDYNTGARPVRNHTTNTTVKVGLSLNNVELDEFSQKMTAVTFLSLSWTDEFLTWNPDEFGGIDRVHFDRDEIWMPDIAVFNSADRDGVIPTSNLPVICFSKGKVMWVPPFTVQVPCQLDIALWPSDLHTCAIRMGSWAHHGEQIALRLAAENAISVSSYNDNKRWTVVNHTAVNGNSQYEDETYFHVDFVFTIKREAASHASYITQTTFAVILMILGSYTLPLYYHLSRLLLHLFALIMLAVCNFVMFISLPPTGGDVPHVVRYFSGTIILTSLSLVCNIFMATTFTGNFKFTPSMSGRLTSFLQSENSRSDRNDSEIAYTTLSEEVIEFSQNNCEQSSSAEQIEKKKTITTRSIFRLLNGVLCVMFSLAYIIDYSVLRNAIGN